MRDWRVCGGEEDAWNVNVLLKHSPRTKSHSVGRDPVMKVAVCQAVTAETAARAGIGMGPVKRLLTVLGLEHCHQLALIVGHQR